MKTQKVKLSFIALLCTILLCLMLCACLTLMPNVAYATDAVAQLENHSYDSYTDTDTFTYEGKPYFIQQYNDNETLKTGYTAQDLLNML